MSVFRPTRIGVWTKPNWKSSRACPARRPRKLSTPLGDAVSTSVGSSPRRSAEYRRANAGLGIGWHRSRYRRLGFATLCLAVVVGALPRAFLLLAVSLL